jgi:UDP-GlcNAc:undecaprenyl-phosphate GlcNAc-1-phosphate transferase
MLKELTNLSYPTIFAIAVVVSALVTPLFREFALRTSLFVQKPKSTSIDTHTRPIPVGGGVAIYLGFVAALLGALWLFGPWTGLEQRILLAGAVLVLFGLLDDSRAIAVPFKFAAQFLAAYLVLLAPGFGAKLPVPQLFGLPALDYAVATLWIVGVINAINFLDIMDGMAAGTSAICAIGFFFVAIIIGHAATLGVLALALAGGALGFLLYNFEPASIFMGDAGSQVLGLVLGALSLLTVSLSSSFVGILAAIVLLGVPLFEIGFTMTIRTLTGKAPWKGSKDHVPLRLFRLGLTVKQVVLLAYVIGLGFIPTAIWMIYADTPGRLIVILALVPLALGAAHWLSRVRVPKTSAGTEETTRTTLKERLADIGSSMTSLWAEE